MKEDLSIKFGAYSLLQRKGDLFYLNVLNWLKKNNWIEKLSKQQGLIRDTKINRISKQNIKISYRAYSKRTKKLEPYIIGLPRMIELNEDFFYFLGLLHGDGLSGARVGIVNIDRNLIAWTSKFLRKTFKHNRLKSQLSIHNNSKVEVKELSEYLNKLSDEFMVYHNTKARGKYVFNIFITNNILRRIINDLIENLENLFLDISFQQKGAFLAGFFDAEGNVNKLDINLRFSQKKEENVRILQTLLQNEGYHIRYDGCNVLIGYKQKYRDDLKLFEKQIFPFLKHSQKKRQTKELQEGYLVRKSYKPILKIIKENPRISQKQVATKINRVKCHRKLIALLNAGFITREGKIGERFKYEITDRGTKYLEEK